MTDGPVTTLVPLARPRGRKAWTFRHAGRHYAVFAVDGQLRVTNAGCPHNGGPLADGIVRNGAITCPWHWYTFDLATGRCRSGANYALRLYPVVRRNGRAFAELPAGGRRSWRRLLFWRAGRAVMSSRPTKRRAGKASCQ
ncbi:MAG: Rieske (2Fe-2S) protein [Streptosporangiaceae bacterium]